MSTKQREVWVDYVKVIACILVALGHLFQSMTKANIIQANSLYTWFETTIYYFHVPLFFICSGYLYQRYSQVRDTGSWLRNVRKKLLVLGVPYFTFSIAEWILKNLFASSVNGTTGGLLGSLFVHPLSPYWFLYCLFFLFAIIPTAGSRREARVICTAALLVKVIAWFVPMYFQLLNYLATNAIWFTAGMLLAESGFREMKLDKKTAIIGSAAYIAISMFAYKISNPVASFFMGIMGCITTIALVRSFEQLADNGFMRWLSKYTMPIFLMHTLCAAPLRVLLMKTSILNPAVQISGGGGHQLYRTHHPYEDNGAPETRYPGISAAIYQV